MNVVVFRIKGSYANFRKVYTTTSSNTLSFPPRTAILGIIGAILGYDNGGGKAYHLEKLSNLETSVIVEKKLEKIRTPVNYIHTKDGGRTQIILELIKNPSYLVFLQKKDFDNWDRLVQMLENGESVFTPYLGLSEFIAKVEFVGIFEAEKEENLPCPVNSVIPQSRAEIMVEKNVLYLKERATRSMDKERKYIEHETYILRKDAQPIMVKSAEVWKVDEWRIIWM